MIFSFQVWKFSYNLQKKTYKNTSFNDSLFDLATAVIAAAAIEFDR